MSEINITAGAVLSESKETPITANSADSPKQREKATQSTPTPAQLRRRRNQRNAWVRAAIQAFFFFLMPGAFVAGFSGVKSIFQHISAGTPLELNSFVMALIGLCGFTILFGRFFCGYACAFGTLGDAVFWLSGLIQKKIFRRRKQIRIPADISPAAQKIKYILLAAIVLTCALGTYDAIAQYNWNPWSVFSFFTALRFEFSGYVIGVIILIVILVGMALKERFFCQFLCPMGAVFSLLPQLPFSWLQRDPGNCIKNCRACQMSCPVDIKLEPDGFRNGECIGCERCAGVCPKANLNRCDRKLFRDELISVLIRAGLLFLLGCWLGLSRI